MDLEQKVNYRSSLSRVEMLTVPEAAAFLGVSKGYLYKLMHRGKIEYYKPSGKLARFERTTLESFLRQNKVVKH